MMLFIMMQAAAVVPVPFRLTILDPACPVTPDTGSITVCGKRAGHYRLPLPKERQANPAPVDRGTGTAALRPPGDCGIFAGQRRCRKAESRA